MARPTNTEERRAQIIDGLARVMAHKTYEQATIAAIAREAGLGPGLVHYHFASKQAILVALVEQLVAGLEARHARRLDAAPDDPWARLDAFIDAFAALDADADPAAVACWTRLGDEAARRPEVALPYRAAVKRWHAALTERVEAILRSDGRPVDAAAEAAAGLLAAIEGAFQLGAAAPGIMPPGAAAGLLKRMARGLLGPATMPSESSDMPPGMPSPMPSEGGRDR